jgi:RNA polymerase sigma factor (sigma-70 family)
MRDWSQIARRLKLVLRRHGRTEQDAEDLIQDAFVRLECYRREKKPVDHPEAFLKRTVLNLSVDAHRSASVRPEVETLVEDAVILDAMPRPDEVYQARERLERLSAGLEALPAKTREIFLAHRLDGVPQGELARQHRLSLNTIEYHVAKATMYLTRWMRDG